MNDSRIINITQLRAFLKATQGIDLSLRQASIEEKYDFISQTIKRLQYAHLSRKEKRVVLNYLKKFTGYKRAQLFRLVKRAIWGRLEHQSYVRTKPHHIYTSQDIKLLEKTDKYHLRLNALATKKIIEREAHLFHHQEYANLARISPSHIYNLRKSTVYKSHYFNSTHSVSVPIGITQPPENFGLPGSIRVDTVHQRDVYHVNAVDEIVQWEIVVCVPNISQEQMEQALRLILAQFPFVIFNFHSDRGGENINYLVAELLQKAHINQTKSRPRHPNDNALVETKNGSVIRKNMGYKHIHQSLCDEINLYYHDFFNPYLNFHRPSLYPLIIGEDKREERKESTKLKSLMKSLKSLL